MPYNHTRAHWPFEGGVGHYLCASLYGSVVRRYGDSTFIAMMWLKSLSGWLANRLGFDFLYLDSDMYFVKDPTPLFMAQPPAIGRAHDWFRHGLIPN
jgi:hypothetical protein